MRQDIFEDLLLDCVVPAQEELYEVAAAQDPDQLAFAVDCGEPLDFVLLHDADGAPLGSRGDRRVAHEIAGGVRAAPGVVPAEQDASDTTPTGCAGVRSALLARYERCIREIGGRSHCEDAEKRLMAVHRTIRNREKRLALSAP